MDKNTVISFLNKNKDIWQNQTPCFVVDKVSLIDLIKEVKFSLIGEIAYSHKTNPEDGILEVILAEGCSLLISSVEELEKVAIKKGYKKDKIIFQSPSLTREQYKKIRQFGVSRFSVDSIQQLEILLEDIAIGAFLEVLVRINTGVKVSNAELPYSSDSFLGFHISEVMPIFDKLNILRKKNKIKLGIHNHLLSQNTFIDMWEKNLDSIVDFTGKLKKDGVILDSIDLGGGYPVAYHHSVPEVKDIAKVIKAKCEKIRSLYKDIKFVFEPGRKLVAEVVTLVTKVTQTKTFLNEKVAILNCSLYNGAMDTLIVGLYLPVEKVSLKATVGNEKLESYFIRGCTPDSLDVFSKNVKLPNLKIGDFLAFLYAGAYSFSSDFISLKKPPYILI
ncbi:MAG: hypothetical protein WC631_03105 [Candidatus Paceibacterota bacterium]|jgi:diaminopimelate decarboxylase